MVLYKACKGNKSRYINHSLCPDIEMRKWIIDGETRIHIFNSHNIQKGEHLTYDYQFGTNQYWHCHVVLLRHKLATLR